MPLDSSSQLIIFIPLTQHDLYSYPLHAVRHFLTTHNFHSINPTQSVHLSPSCCQTLPHNPLLPFHYPNTFCTLIPFMPLETSSKIIIFFPLTQHNLYTYPFHAVRHFLTTHYFHSINRTLSLHLSPSCCQTLSHKSLLSFL
jgi:hypothetical protein